ncbi:LysR family transcriptional regulator [Arenibaculum sp.]|jgi:DNA-binding transcriptional LysR family regulator|uniref:LysR family transcriptional regulator n=1 Tax=Arenibaculum sp. TaxID=2865862 RepID=UPI002E0DDF1E|nr:LysR substrate-binding domain-containing protein [Arenibaculum sp.]
MQERSGAHLEQIEAFAAVAERGGIAAAARALGRDASVISRRLDALEARLGVRLLSRTTRRVAVTEVGAAYLRRVQAVLSELSAADVEASEGAAMPRGLLRLSLPAAFTQRWIAPWLPEFIDTYPALQLDLVHADRFVDLVAEGFDAAVRIGELADSSLVARRLATFDTVLCASPAYLAGRGVPARPEDLGRHACLLLPKARFWPNWRLRAGDERVTLRVSGPITSDEGEGLLAACLGGAGILPAAEWMIGKELADGRLVRVLAQWSFDYEGAIQVVLPPGRLVPAKTRVFVDRLAREFTPTAPWLRASAPFS